MQNYQDWIRLVAELTVNSLNAWHWSGSSVYYLLGLWSRLVSSMPYLKGDSPSLLDTFVPKISRAYINSRSVHAILAPLTKSSRQTARLSSNGPFTDGSIPLPMAPHTQSCTLPLLQAGRPTCSFFYSFFFACLPLNHLPVCRRGAMHAPASNLQYASVRKSWLAEFSSLQHDLAIMGLGNDASHLLSVCLASCRDFSRGHAGHVQVHINQAVMPTAADLMQAQA